MNFLPFLHYALLIRPAREGSLKSDRNARGIRIADSPLILIRGEDVGPISDQPVGLVDLKSAALFLQLYFDTDTFMDSL